jgi:hypothetical protein
MRPQPNTRRVFEILPHIMHLPLVRHRDEWWGACYINGAKHARQDKLVAKIYKGRILILEQGGDVLTIESWLMQYGGAANYPMALDILNGECDSHILQRYEPMITNNVAGGKYIPQIEWDRAKTAVSVNHCNLFKWLCKYYDEKDVMEVMNRYQVTVDDKFNTVFWYINKDNKICKDKVIKYSNDGHRDKQFGATSNYRTKDGYSNRCYFGEVLIGLQEDVYIVESEKTALICALEFPHSTWIATGGASCLMDIKPTWKLYPDFDKAGKSWEQKYPENCIKWYEGEDVEVGNDIGDIIISKKTRKNFGN